MKKTAFLLALCFLLSGILCACGKKTVPAQQTQTAEPSAADVSAQRETEDGSDVSSAELPADLTLAEQTAADGKPVSSPAAGTAETSESTAKGSGQTDAPDASSSVTAKADSPASSTKPGETTAKADDPVTSTKPGETTAKADASVTSTKPGETTRPDATNHPGESATQPSVTESTTVYVPAVGQKVNAKMTYLKEAAVTYVSALNESDLERFGITGDKAREILKNKSDWAAYTIQIDFRNDEKMPITIYYLDVQDNGRGDVFVNGDTAGELGLMSGSKMTERFYVLAKKSDSDGSILNKLQKMNMRVQYAATLEDDMATPSFVYSNVE